MNKLILATFAALALAACGSSVESGQGGATTTATTSATGSTTTTSSTTSATTSSGISCPSGTKYAEPGCGDAPGATPLPAAGCYPTCTTEGAPCVAGGGCTKTWTNPCLCPDPNGACCGACGGEELLCLP